MVDPGEFHASLQRYGVGFYVGVPDSTMASFCWFLQDNLSPAEHVIAANEGSAIGLAIGHYLASAGLPLIYLQNSGLGNAVNPLLSLADVEVYSIPMLLLIGWRGRPGNSDEPQHRKQGRILTDMLNSMEIPWAVLEDDPPGFARTVAVSVRRARETNGPAALLITPGFFSPYARPPDVEISVLPQREAAIAQIVSALPDATVVVASTGLISRELDEISQRNGNRRADFLCVGGMGHASQVALGMALAQPQRRVVCLDGDGAALMHLGGLTTIGTLAPRNLLHLVLNNGSHSSVGGQPTVACDIDLSAIARAAGYVSARRVTSLEGLCDAVSEWTEATSGAAFVDVRLAPGQRPDLGRPLLSPLQAKTALMKWLS